VAFGYHNAPEYQKNALFMDNDALRADTEKKMKTFDVRPPIPTLAAKSFSGGNQQKIVVAREIERNPDLLLVGQPTRGVDIGAIEFIHKQIVETARCRQGDPSRQRGTRRDHEPLGPHRRDVRRQRSWASATRRTQNERDTWPDDGRHRRLRI
jgi:hypothetical protein